MRSFTIASVILASASSSMATLHINNWCGAPVYWWANNGCGDGNMHTIQANKGNNDHIGHHDFIPACNGGGVSIKMATVPNLGAAYSGQVTQFEYTLTGGNLWYDLSDINGNPFFNDNVKVTPTGRVSNHDRCIKLRCPAGHVCQDAYNAPKDDWATHVCPTNGLADIWIDLCDPHFSAKRSVEFKA